MFLDAQQKKIVRNNQDFFSVYIGKFQATVSRQKFSDVNGRIRILVVPDSNFIFSIKDDSSHQYLTNVQS